MRFVIAVAMVAAAISAVGEAISESEAMRQGTDAVGKTKRQSISAPAAWEGGFPIPAGARRNESLGGATSLAPGKNYTVRVYDTEAGIEATRAFYKHHLLDASRVEKGQEVKFSTKGGHVTLASSGKGTRITLAIGPR